MENKKIGKIDQNWISFSARRKLHFWPLSVPVLPDGVFSNKKSQIG
jgi:hypothetical protein